MFSSRYLAAALASYGLDGTSGATACPRINLGGA